MVALASHAWGGPAVRYSWDSCNSVVLNKMFTGPGAYTQIVAAVGLNKPLLSWSISIGLGNALPDAWSFYYGGCQGSSREVTVTSGGGCPRLPNFSVRSSLYNSIADDRWHLSVHGSAMVGPIPMPDSSVRYALAVVLFDHSRSATGLQDPAVACGGAERGLCFVVEDARLLWVDRTLTVPWLENGYLAWQDPNNLTNCPAATPARASTWGQIKSLYR